MVLVVSENKLLAGRARLALKCGDALVRDRGMRGQRLRMLVQYPCSSRLLARLLSRLSKLRARRRKFTGKLNFARFLPEFNFCADSPEVERSPFRRRSPSRFSSYSHRRHSHRRVGGS